MNRKNNIIKIFFLGLMIICIGFYSPDLLAQGSPEYANPLAVGSFTELITKALGIIQSLVGYLTVIMVVLGGIIYMASGGNESMVTLAKNMIKYAFIGFILVIAFPTLLKEIKDIASGGGAVSISGATEIGPVLIKVLNFLLTLVGILATMVLIIGAIMFLISGGGSSKVEQAKKLVYYAIVSIAISAGALILLNQILNFF